jgi:hypothetical protein
MKILFDNILNAATLTSLHEEESYPVTNVVSPFLRQLYQASESNDTITAEFSTDVALDSIFWGFTNATRLRIALLDSDDAVMEIVYLEGESVGHYYGYDEGVYGYGDNEFYGYYDSVSDKFYDPAVYHWPKAYTGVRKIIIEAETDEAKLYIGGIGMGVCFVMPNPNENFSEGWIDNSIISRSQAGQVVRDYVIPLKQYTFRFSYAERSQMNALRQVYIDNGIGAKVWLDSTERNHEFVAPMFGIIEEWTADEKNGKNYRFGMTITEAR